MEADAILMWSIEVEAHGIEVSALFMPDEKAGESQTAVAIQTMKVKAAAGVQDGTFSSQDAGSCEFTFNNAYSVFNSKTLHFKCEVSCKSQ